jgi:outer membrane protein assembly factor BamA
MRVSQLLAATFAVSLVVCAASDADPATQRELLENDGEAGLTILPGGDEPIIQDISFTGLRRIAREAVAAQMAMHAGERLDRTRLANDVRRLGRLGWFAAVRVEVVEVFEHSVAAERPAARTNRPSVQLKFCLAEHPFLTGVEFDGSRLLSKKQIEKLLADQHIPIRLGEPENLVTLCQAANAIRRALAALGHPDASVQMRHEKSANATVRVRFDIQDGPNLPIGRVTFKGSPGVPPKILRRQMEHLRPDAWFAGLRGKNVYTEEGFAEDRERLAAYYQNHGYPQARIGPAEVSRVEKASRRWLAWAQNKGGARLHVVIPVESGPLYRVEALQASEALRAKVAAAGKTPPTIPPEAQPSRTYSARAIETVRRGWQTRVQPKPRQSRQGCRSSLRTSRSVQPRGRGHAGSCIDTSLLVDSKSFVNVEAIRTLDSTSHAVRIRLEPSATAPYTVRKLEFRGLRRFPDQYFRRRFSLQEGAPFDDGALETGIARLARTTYFKPIKKEDVHVVTNDATHTADVIIQVEELGQQRAAMVGGRGQFGSTVGIVYTIFNLLHGEELLSSHLEGGPESLQLAIGFAKEGVLGSRGSLALSVFNTLLRPRLSGSTKGPFFEQEGAGVDATWSYALTNVDALGVSYDRSHIKTQYAPLIPAGVTGLTVGDIRTATSSRAAGLGWTHDSGAERIVLADSVSGGWLGGSESLVRSKVEFERAWHDPIFDPQNAWAFRITASGVGSYSGDLPFYARLFAGDDFVRGLRAGELGPQAVIASASSNGRTKYAASAAGADLLSAANAEYRVRLSSSTEATSFFDIGSGMLLPNWLGRTRPALIESTNRILHISTGIQGQWTVPGIGVPVRAYYAVNALRLNRWLPMPDGSLIHATTRRSAFGWGLAPMF